jgi:hypothetical protein
MLCAQGPVRSPVELSLEPEFRRRHGSVYDALAHGQISSSRLRHLLIGLSAPARAGEPLMFAIDTTPHARPDAEYSTGTWTHASLPGQQGFDHQVHAAAAGTDAFTWTLNMALPRSS